MVSRSGDCHGESAGFWSSAECHSRFASAAQPWAQRVIFGVLLACSCRAPRLARSVWFHCTTLHDTILKSQGSACGTLDATPTLFLPFPTKSRLNFLLIKRKGSSDTGCLISLPMQPMQLSHHVFHVCEILPSGRLLPPCSRAQRDLLRQCTRRANGYTCDHRGRHHGRWP